jgi:hypothetical protein
MKILHLDKRVNIDEISYDLEFFQFKNVKWVYKICIFKINYNRLLDEFEYRWFPWFGFYISILSSCHILFIKFRVKSASIEFKFLNKEY